MVSCLIMEFYKKHISQSRKEVLTTLSLWLGDYISRDLRLQVPPVQFWLSMSLPMQYRPPCFGAGLLHSRRRNWRQSALHEDHEAHEDHFPSTEGQIWLQDFFWTWGPSQPGPPLTGAGWSQVRVRFRTPRPHFVLHSDHSPHVLHLPGTKIKKRKNWEL